MFTKNYEAIAEIIKSEYTCLDNTGKDDTEAKLACKGIAIKLADYFEWDNLRFDRDKFIAACGVG